MCRPAKTATGRAGTGAGGRGRAGVLPFEARQLAAEPLLAQTALVEPREAERSLRRRAGTRAGPASRPARRPAQILAPVLARPDLVPVDDEPEAAAAAQCSCREQREVRKRGGVDDVVAPSVAQQVARDAEPEDQRRQDAPPAARVELHPR